MPLKHAYDRGVAEFKILQEENQKLAQKHAELIAIIKEARLIEQQAQYEV